MGDSAAQPGQEQGQGQGRQAVERELVTRCGLLYRGTMAAIRVLLWPWLRVQVEGAEHLPAGGALVAANHGSWLDIPVLGRVLFPRHAAFVARSTLQDSRLLALLMRRTGAILVERGQSDRAALRRMALHLEAEDLVAIFPEGTRSPDGSLQPFKGGALLAARMAGRPIVPCGIRGAFEAWPRGQRLPRPGRVTVAFGPSVDPAAPGALELVRERVAALMGDSPQERGQRAR